MPRDAVSGVFARPFTFVDDANNNIDFSEARFDEQLDDFAAAMNTDDVRMDLIEAAATANAAADAANAAATVALESRDKGAHADLAALTAAHPTGVTGDWATLTKTGEPDTRAIWDADANAWVDTGEDVIDAYTKTESDALYFQRTGGGLFGRTITDGSTGQIDDAGGSRAGLEVVANSGTEAAFIDFHIPGVFAQAVGISPGDGGTLFRGAWSNGANKYALIDETNLALIDSHRAVIKAATPTTGATQTPDGANGQQWFKHTVTSALTIAPPVNMAEKTAFVVELLHTTPSAVTFNGAYKLGDYTYTPSTNAGEVDILVFAKRDASTYSLIGANRTV